MAKKTSSERKLSLTEDELCHLRDLMSATITTQQGCETISSCLSYANGREDADKTLWKKVYDMCVACNIVVEENAPDYAVLAATPPAMNVYEVTYENGVEGQDE